MSNKFFIRNYQLDNGVIFAVTNARGAEIDVRRAIGDFQTDLDGKSELSIARLGNMFAEGTTWNNGYPLATVDYRIVRNPYFDGGE